MIRYLSTGEVGAWFGRSGRTVVKWRGRYPDFPEPDAGIGEVAGWLPERETEIREWHARRPGQGWRRASPEESTA